jgi:hypothetical protein
MHLQNLSLFFCRFSSFERIFTFSLSEWFVAFFQYRYILSYSTLMYEYIYNTFIYFLFIDWKKLGLNSCENNQKSNLVQREKEKERKKTNCGKRIKFSTIRSNRDKNYSIYVKFDLKWCSKTHKPHVLPDCSSSTTEKRRRRK